MTTRLTLHLDEGLIEKAKTFSRAQGKSVSQLVADYFSALESVDQALPLPPGVASLRGVLKGEDLDAEDYRRHLRDKYDVSKLNRSGSKL